MAAVAVEEVLGAEIEEAQAEPAASDADKRAVAQVGAADSEVDRAGLAELAEGCTARARDEAGAAEPASILRCTVSLCYSAPADTQVQQDPP